MSFSDQHVGLQESEVSEEIRQALMRLMYVEHNIFSYPERAISEMQSQVQGDYNQIGNPQAVGIQLEL